MKLRGMAVAALLVAAFGFSPDVAAQTGGATPVQREPVHRFDWRAYALFDTNAVAASRTFDALFQTTTVSASGFGAEVMNVWRGLLVRAAVSWMEEKGSRAVVFDGDPVRLGIPLTLKLRPMEVGLGWRFRTFGTSRVVPYGGVGLVRLDYREHSEFADPTENSHKTFSGSVAFGGVEVRVAPWIVAGVEAQYRAIDALGTGGASKEFGERNLGGTTLRLLVGVRR